MTRLDHLGPPAAATSPSRYIHSIMARELVIDGIGYTWELHSWKSADRLEPTFDILYLLMPIFVSSLSTLRISGARSSAHLDTIWTPSTNRLSPLVMVGTPSF